MTEIVPEVTPLGAVTVNELVVAEFTTAVVPLNFTLFPEVVAEKLDPEIVTEVPATPKLGEKLDMDKVVEPELVVVLVEPELEPEPEPVLVVPVDVVLEAVPPRRSRIGNKLLTSSLLLGCEQVTSDKAIAIESRFSTFFFIFRPLGTKIILLKESFFY